MLLDLKIPPGVYKNGTEYQAKGRYSDCNLVRWYEGTMRPVGGWRTLLGGSPRVALQIVGKARGSHAWRSNSSDAYVAFGTHTKLYARVGAVNAPQDITPTALVAGFADTQAVTGYGGGAYGYDTYGTARTPLSFANIATTWSMDNYGQFLVAVQSQDGRLFYWNLTDAQAKIITPTAGVVPINNKGVVVTDERFVMCLQANGNRKLIQWSDQENLFRWDITATTQAGDFELQTSGEIMCAVKARGQLLIITSVDAHAANYIGPPLVYGFERVGTGCGAISRNAAVAVDKQAFWMGQNNFYAFDGFVKDVPCDVSDYVFSRINRAQMAKIWATHNPDFSEVTWFYPSGMEVDSYVTYNYAENHWATGSMSRTTGVNNQILTNAVRVDANGILYEHEVGFGYEGVFPFAETAPIEIENGSRVFMAKYLFPDEKTQGNVVARFSTQFYPNAPDYPFGPYSMSNPTSVRFTGRQIQMRVEGATNTDWRVGVPRLDVEPGGLR